MAEVETIYILGDVEDCERAAVEKLLDSRGEIHVVIDSGGGSIYSAMAIARLIRLIGNDQKTTAIVIGDCSSSATLIFAACRERYMHQGTSCLFHKMTAESGTLTEGTPIANWANEMNRVADNATEALERWIGEGFPSIKRIEARGEYVTSYNMRMLGAASEILEDGTILRPETSESMHG